MSSDFADPHLRPFGVEIECGLQGGTEQACDLFDIAYNDYYDEIDEDQNDEGWSVDSDGTDVEVRTPILVGEAGFSKLRWAMETLKNAGAYVTNADGMHVHHDAPEFVANPASTLQLVKSWRNNELAIYDLVATRRRGSAMCPTWAESHFEMLEAWAKGDTSYLSIGRNDLNVASLTRHGSVEVRLHEGTLDADVAIAWVKFGQQFIFDTLQSIDPMEPVANAAELMSRIRLVPEAIALLEAKRDAGHITAGSEYRTRRLARYRDEY